MLVFFLILQSLGCPINRDRNGTSAWNNFDCVTTNVSLKSKRQASANLLGEDGISWSWGTMSADLKLSKKCEYLWIPDYFPVTNQSPTVAEGDRVCDIVIGSHG